MLSLLFPSFCKLLGWCIDEVRSKTSEQIRALHNQRNHRTNHSSAVLSGEYFLLSGSRSQSSPPTYATLSSSLILPVSDLVASTDRSGWVQEFAQPFDHPDFFAILNNQQVILEYCSSTTPNTIFCFIRVKNLAYNKCIIVNYTINSSNTFSAYATFVPHSSDGDTDMFSVKLCIEPPTIGDRLKFLVRYHVTDNEYIDNNGGTFYSLLYTA